MTNVGLGCDIEYEHNIKNRLLVKIFPLDLLGRQFSFVRLKHDGTHSHVSVVPSRDFCFSKKINNLRRLSRENSAHVPICYNVFYIMRTPFR